MLWDLPPGGATGVPQRFGAKLGFVEDGAGAVQYPPPPVRDPLALVVAWLILGAAALAIVTLVSRAAGSAGAGGRFSIGTQLVIVLAAVAVACTAVGLLRGRRWAAPVMVGEFVLGSIACFVTAVLTAQHPPGPAATDGASYAVLSGFVFGLGLIAAAALLALPSTRRRFNGPPAGWYTDPAIEARLRWWNGQQWTTSTVS